MAFCCVVLGLVLLSACTWQEPGFLRDASELESSPTPAIQPEPRLKIQGDPRQIFHLLLSASEVERSAARRFLQWPSPETPTVKDARLQLINLDDDDELEAIVLLSGSPPSTIALVFDHQRDGWWQVGRFDYSWHWHSDQAERMIELRELILPGRKDILVRTSTGGTGIAETSLAIYRMHKGRLYRVFHTIEDASHYAHTPTTSVSEHRRIEYRADADGRFLVVHQIIHEEPEKPSTARPASVKETCSVYAWDPARFAFIPSARDKRRFCPTQ